MSDPIGLALIGAGNVVRRQYLPLLRGPDCPFRVLHVYDIDRQAAAAVADVLGAHAARTSTAALDDDGVVAVCVCTPVLEHAQLVIAAARAGRHVLCEKPLGGTAQEAYAMVAAAQQSGVAHVTRFSFRFRPEVEALASLLHAGELGRIYHLRAELSQGHWFTSAGAPSPERDDATAWRYLPGGGVLLDMAPHLIDLCLWLLGDVLSVAAWTRTFQICSPAAEDSCGIVLGFGAGTVAQLMISRWETGRREVFRVEIAGSEGAAVLDGRKLRVWTRSSGRWATPAVRPPSHRDFLHAFRQRIADRAVAVPSFIDGARVNDVIDAAFASARQSSVVVAPHTPPRGSYPDGAPPTMRTREGGVPGRSSMVPPLPT